MEEPYDLTRCAWALSFSQDGTDIWIPPRDPPGGIPPPRSEDEPILIMVQQGPGRRTTKRD
jgi:hypothetical protein